ncbi:MAG: ferredoxin [Hespellia sp.]|nr:ferredoxin [Hespellia sp.]
MKYYVNEECIGCGMCNGICPEVFEMTGEGVAKAAEGDVSPENEDAAEEAKAGCPVSAIEKL